MKRNPLPRKEADLCTRCASCMAVCPVARVAPRFPGPKQAGPGAERHCGGSPGGEDTWMDLCLGCRLCDVSCPSGVPVYDLNLSQRMAHRYGKRRLMRDWLLSHTYLVGTLGSRMPRLANLFLKNRVLARLLDLFTGLDKEAELPCYESQTFTQWFSGRRFESDRKIAYFYGCYTDTNEAEVGKAVVEVLEKAGIGTVLPFQVCCGIPLLGACDLKGARKAALRNVPSLLAAVREGHEVIFSSSSCGLMIKHEYARLPHVPGAGEVGAHTHDFCEYLLALIRSGAVRLDLKALPVKAAYFAPCHLKSLAMGLPALELLRMIPGIEVRNLETDCCGQGGAYGFKKEKAGISAAIGQDLAREIASIGPDLVVSDCEGCRMQIRHLTGLKVVHPAQLLLESCIR